MQTIRIQRGLAIAGLIAGNLLGHSLRTGAQILLRPIPARIVVLSFDDAVRSDYQTVAPVLKRYGFHATFFVCEFPPDFSDGSKYMTWYDIRQLSGMGFEIANHTRTHMHVPAMDSAQFAAQPGYIEQKWVDKAHPWVTTPPELFYQYMAYLQLHHYQMLSMEDLQRYINPLAALKAHPGT